MDINKVDEAKKIIEERDDLIKAREVLDNYDSKVKLSISSFHNSNLKSGGIEIIVPKSAYSFKTTLRTSISNRIIDLEKAIMDL